ncbi:MAG: hypothetical protein ACM3XM_16285 [Mycobacterium leprae]
MVVLWLAGALLLLWATLWFTSVMVLKGRGGEVPVDNNRDIDPRYFARMLRSLLTPVLEPHWGGRGYGWVDMHRRLERVRVYQGDVELRSAMPEFGAIVVKGNLRVLPGIRVTSEIWCLGDVEVGPRCTLRTLAADGSAFLGKGVMVERWVDAGKGLHMGPDVTVVARATAGEALVLGRGFRGGRISAPSIRTAHSTGQPGVDRHLIAEACRQWNMLRRSQQAVAASAQQAETDRTAAARQWDEGERVAAAAEHRLLEQGAMPAERRAEFEWVMPQSVCTGGDYWVGPATTVLQDVVCRGSADIGDDTIIAGSVHADKDLHLGQRTLVTGSVACRTLIMERGAIVAGSAHVAGDAVLEDGAVVGLLLESGGLAATGSVDLKGEAAISLQIAAGNAIST